MRPLTSSGLTKFRAWIENQNWADIINIQSVDAKAEMLHSMVLSKLDEFCPEKQRKLSNDDCPWFTEQLKKLDRKKRREYNKNRRSHKYMRLKRLFDKKVSREKKMFKSKMIDDVMTTGESQWYSALKRITNYGQEKSEHLRVEEISHLSDKQQAEAIADSFSAISNEYEPVNKDAIKIPPFHSSDIPQIKPYKVRKYLEKIKTNKSTAPGDIPAKIIKEFALYLCVPLTDVINSGMKAGHWPLTYKREMITPTPKQSPPETVEMLRPIANLFNFDKVMEKIVSEMIISDMQAKLDPSQYGNRKHTSIQHYLVRMLHRILTSLDRNSKGEVNAVLCLFIDWKQAYSRQCHTLGVQSFIDNGVRPALIPLLVSYFEDRQMRVKWHGETSAPRQLPGGGAMGASLGNWEFLSQTNNNADCVPVEDRFKFVDD